MAETDKTGNGRKASLARIIMIVGGFVSLAIGFGFGCWVTSADYSGVYDGIAVGSASFTFCGFWAAFFQLQSIKDQQKAERKAAELAVQDILNQQLILKIRESRVLLEIYRNLLLNKRYDDAVGEHRMLILNLNAIKNHDRISDKIKSYISGTIIRKMNNTQLLVSVSKVDPSKIHTYSFKTGARQNFAAQIIEQYWANHISKVYN